MAPAGFVWAQGWVFRLMLIVAMSGGWIGQGIAKDSNTSALGALQRLDYDGAATILGYLAEAGDAKAQAALSTLIESGALANDHPTPALDLLRRAANQNLPEAALELGNRNYLGTGLPRDHSQAIKWWEIAAENGAVAAAFNLGLAYAKGDGTAPDPQQAQHWFSSAMNSGSVEARFALGVMQFEQENFTDAFVNFEIAAVAGLAIAQYNLGTMYEYGYGCPLDLAQAISWYQQAAAADVLAATASLKRLDNPPTPTATLLAKDIQGSRWVASQPSDHYALQVASGISEAATVAILRCYDVNAVRAYLAVAPTGDVRYIALVGSFASYMEALSFLNALDPKLRTNNPWIRRYSSVQALSIN